MNKIIDFLSSLSGKNKANIEQWKLDSFQKEDTVAKNTSWLPLKKWGINIKSHNLEESDGILKYSISLQFIALYGIFIAIGGFMSLWWLLSWYSNKTIEQDNIMVIIFWLIYSGIGLYFLLKSRKNRWVFDRYVWFAYVGKLPDIIQTSGDNTVISLSQIHAIQIIPEWVSGKNSFVSYEINIVLKDFSRHNIVDHGNIKKIREDAEKISMFLGVRMWDVTI